MQSCQFSLSFPSSFPPLKQASPVLPHYTTMKCSILALLLAAPALAFMPSAPTPQRTQVSMSASRDWKKDIAKAAIVALPMLAPLVAGAKIDYEGEWNIGRDEERGSG